MWLKLGRILCNQISKSTWSRKYLLAKIALVQQKIGQSQAKNEREKAAAILSFK